ncbi:MAG TPA: hypothetical protein VJZ49_03585 [Syntrophales bacterium]|nr:hypothetical protein [Syntrophales bacterium]
MVKKLIMVSIISIATMVVMISSVTPSFGDATIETTFKTSGVQGMGTSEVTAVKRYQGDKRWESSSMKFTGAVLSRLVGGRESITITRVDKGVYWTPNPKNKTYQETLIAPPKIKESPEPSKKTESEKEEKPRARITKSEFTVKKTGASEVINGFPCEEYLVTWLLEMEDIETKAKSKSTMTTNPWTTHETTTIKKAQAEEQRFEQALAKKLGIELSPEEAKQMGMAVFASMSGASETEVLKGLTKIKNEMAKIKGYPIRTVVAWTLEGDEQKVQQREEAKEEHVDMSGGIGGLLGGLAGKMAKKKVEEKIAPKKGAPFFSSTMEVKAIDSGGVSADTFEIPPEYTKK